MVDEDDIGLRAFYKKMTLPSAPEYDDLPEKAKEIVRRTYAGYCVRVGEEIMEIQQQRRLDKSTVH